MSATKQPNGLTADEEQETILVRKALPKLRFTTFIFMILTLDFVLALILWTVGGTKTLKSTITQFTFLHSVFDLVCISFLKTIILLVVFWQLEKNTICQVSLPFNVNLSRTSLILHAVAIVLSLACFVYCVTKSALVNIEWAKPGHNDVLSLTHFVLVNCAMGFCFVELLAALQSISKMKKLKEWLTQEVPNDASESEEKKGKKQKVNLRRLLTLAKPESGILGVGIIALIVGTISQTLAPLYFGKVIDAARNHTTMDELNTTTLTLFGIYGVGSIFGGLRAWLFTLAGQRLVARIRIQLFSSIIKQEVAFFDTNRTGELTNRLASDTQVIQNSLTVNISMLARYFLQIVGALILMFLLSPKLAAVLIAVVPLVAIGAQHYGKYVRDLQKSFQDQLAAGSTTAEESLSNIRTVRSFSQEPKSIELYAEDINQSYRTGKKLAVASGAFNGIIQLVGQGAVVLVLWYGGKLVFESQMTVGTLTAFMLYTINVAMSFVFLSSLFGDFMKAVGASYRIFELMDKQPEINTTGGDTLNPLTAAIEFKDVWFKYPSRPDTDVLKGIMFNIKPGETVALVGPSGGGKSTVINMIERFYDPIEGVITLGGANLCSLDPQWFRRKVSMVSQEPVLFATTISKNIAYGRDASPEEIEEAAKQANAHEFISSFEETYETQVGERGVKLSGGQKQRVAIARALLMDPEILLLDEATSALDAESEHLVQEAIERAMVSRTVLVIAHRLSTVRNASKVIVIDKGKIVEQGTHDELVEQGGVYKKLVLRQLNAGQVNKDDVDDIGTSVGDSGEGSGNSEGDGEEENDHFKGKMDDSNDKQDITGGDEVRLMLNNSPDPIESDLEIDRPMSTTSSDKDSLL